MCEDDVNNEQKFCGYYNYVKPLNKGLIILLPKKKLLFWLLFSGKSIQNIIAPSSAGIRPVVNRLN